MRTHCRKEQFGKNTEDSNKWYWEIECSVSSIYVNKQRGVEGQLRRETDGTIVESTRTGRKEWSGIV